MNPLRHVFSAAALATLATALVPAHAQGVIKIGEVNSYKAQPAFLEPYKKAGSWRWRRSMRPAGSTARRSS